MIIRNSQAVLLVTGFALAAIAAGAAFRQSTELRNIVLRLWNLRYAKVAPPLAGATTVHVRADVRHQAIEGFGAGVQTLVIEGRDVLPPPLRTRAIEAVFEQVGLTMGMVEQILVERREARLQNDNDDPNLIDWSGFQTDAIDSIGPSLLDLPSSRRFDNYHFGQRINTRWAAPWLAQLRQTDYRRYLDEAAEQILAGCRYWRNRVGPVPRWLQLFNEPLSGNHELKGAGTGDLVDIVATAGERLRREGFGDARFVVASEETEEKSYDSAAAILADARARPFVGAIGYHPYPYTSPYANVRRLLRTSALGRPDAARIAARRRLRDLARAYGVPLWMTEVSTGGVDPRSYEDFRGRVIHIHDELMYADASAYFGMMTMWDVAQPLHDSIVPAVAHEGTIVLVDSASDSVDITGMGYAIGHYARWIRRGARRVDAQAGDSLLQVTAFRDDLRRMLTLVLINNASSSRTISVTIDGVRLSGDIRGEQSTQTAYWSPIAAFRPSTTTGFTIDMGPTSVTTVSAAYAGSPDSTRKQLN